MSEFLDTEPQPKSMFESRAVLRAVREGADYDCAAEHDNNLERHIRYAPTSKSRKLGRGVVVICNVYVDEVWQRTEHYHPHCYNAAGKPYGEILKKLPVAPEPQGVFAAQLLEDEEW